MVQRVAAPGGDSIMVVSPTQIRNLDYLKNETNFATGIHTEYGKEGGKSIINNIDNILADPDTLREIQEEFKYSKDNSTIFH